MIVSTSAKLNVDGMSCWWFFRQCSCLLTWVLLGAHYENINNELSTWGFFWTNTCNCWHCDVTKSPSHSALYTVKLDWDLSFHCCIKLWDHLTMLTGLAAPASNRWQPTMEQCKKRWKLLPHCCASLLYCVISLSVCNQHWLALLCLYLSLPTLNV